MRDSRRQFLEDEFFAQTTTVLVQRGNVLLPQVGTTGRQQFHTSLRQALQRFDAQYTEPVDEFRHIQNLVALADELSAVQAGMLIDGRWSIGMTQKTFNFYLKYQWCMGWIPMPPHCPFDPITFPGIPSLRDIRWTQLNTIAEYLAGVAAAKRVANGVPLAVWELELAGRMVRESNR